nr:MAG TPA: hypothetical protein [Caudoviricetes sp.]
MELASRICLCRLLVQSLLLQWKTRLNKIRNLR